MQQQNLLKAENVNLKFDNDAIKKMAEYAYEMNQNTENIGARRLHAIVEKILEDISFDASERQG
jgi:ATP-dependent HslUV protease ATP-binding subunit HslU